MRVRFAEDVLNDKECFRRLDRIVDYFVEERHVWDVDSLEDVLETEWIKSGNGGYSSQINMEVMKKCYTATAYKTMKMHTKFLIVTNNVKAVTELRPNDADRCLSQPAYVLVENADSDGAFLDAMISCFKRLKLQNAQTDGWWHYEHLGGFGEIEKRINQLLARTVGPPRIFVLADSDRLVNNQKTMTVTKIEKACNKNNIPFAILKKRKIENYLPLTLLHYQGKHKVFDAYKSLKHDQRDYYEMKKGFKLQNGIGCVDPAQSALYADVNKHNRIALCGGFGDKIYELFSKKRTELKSEDVVKICSSDPKEIENILDEIEKIL